MKPTQIIFDHASHASHALQVTMTEVNAAYNAFAKTGRTAQALPGVSRSCHCPTPTLPSGSAAASSPAAAWSPQVRLLVSLHSCLRMAVLSEARARL